MGTIIAAEGEVCELGGGWGISFRLKMTKEAGMITWNGEGNNSQRQQHLKATLCWNLLQNHTQKQKEKPLITLSASSLPDSSICYQFSTRVTASHTPSFARWDRMTTITCSWTVSNLCEQVGYCNDLITSRIVLHDNKREVYNWASPSTKKIMCHSLITSDLLLWMSPLMISGGFGCSMTLLAPGSCPTSTLLVGTVAGSPFRVSQVQHPTQPFSLFISLFFFFLLY